MPSIRPWDSARVEADIAARRPLYVAAALLLVLSEGLSALGVVAGTHFEFKAFAYGSKGLLVLTLVAAFGVFLATWPTRRELVAAVSLGAVLEAGQIAWRIAHHAPLIVFLRYAGAGFGMAGVLVCIVSAFTGEKRRESLARLTAIGLFPTFMFLSRTLVDLTITLHPRVWDRVAYAAGAAFGFAPAFAAGRFAESLFPGKAFYDVLLVVYFTLPVPAAILQAVQLRHPERSRDDIGYAFVLAGLVGGLLYNVVPTLGPVYLFGNSVFPWSPPDPSTLALGPVLAPKFARNGIPSLHTTWALLLFWQSRPHSGWLRRMSAAFLALTLLATVGIGEHYLIDLIVTVPFAVAIEACVASKVSWRRRERWLPVAVGAGYVVSWSTLFLAFPGFFLHRAIALLAYALTVIPPLVLHRALDRAARSSPLDEPEKPAARCSGRATSAPLTLLFSMGVAAAIGLEGALAALSPIAGRTTATTSEDLLLILVAVAVGTWVAGHVDGRTPAAERGFAACALGIGIACGVAPWLSGAFQAAYATLAGGDAAATMARLAISGIVLFPPALFLGATFPLAARAMAGEAPRTGAVGAMLSSLFLGGGTGALLAGYVLFPSLGVARSALVALLVMLGVALAATRLPDSAGAPRGTAAPRAWPDRRRATLRGYGILVAAGFVALAITRLYAHLLAIVAGTTIYASAAVAIACLSGLGAGAGAARAILRWGCRPAEGLRLAFGLAAVCVAVGVFSWSSVPAYFASYANYTHAQRFEAREFVRLVLVWAWMAPPTALLGASFVFAFEPLMGGVVGAVKVVTAGTAAIALGGAAGALAVSSFVLPQLGSLRGLELVASASAALAAGTLGGTTRAARIRGCVPIVAAALLLFFRPHTFDLDGLTAGASAHFAPEDFGRVVDQSESAEGLATVARREDGVRSLLSDGRLEGLDSPEELRAVEWAAVIPLLHTAQRGRALLAGFGLGAGAHIAADAGFSVVNVAEPRSDLVTLAARDFRAVSGDVLERPSVRLHAIRARAWLLGETAPYDLIAIDAPSLEPAASEALYDADFHRIVASRLSSHGVLAEWVPLDHVRPTDYVTLLASARASFPKVWLYAMGTRGVLVACAADCAPSPEALAALTATPGLEPMLERLGGPRRLLADRMLTPDGVERFLTAGGVTAGAVDDLLATDDNNLLAYSVAHESVASDDASPETNLAMFRAFRPASDMEGTRVAASP